MNEVEWRHDSHDWKTTKIQKASFPSLYKRPDTKSDQKEHAIQNTRHAHKQYHRVRCNNIPHGGDVEFSTVKHVFGKIKVAEIV